MPEIFEVIESVFQIPGLYILEGKMLTSDLNSAFRERRLLRTLRDRYTA